MFNIFPLPSNPRPLRYGRKLVVVASQTLRFRTLIGVESDPDLKLNDGELQSNLHGCSFKTDARKLHYMRMSLVKHGLISMHSHVRRLKSRQQQYSILLLLKRFYINRRSKYDLLMEQASNLLQQTPGQVTPVMNVDERNFRRIFQCMQAAKLVESCQYPLEDLDPSAGPCANKRGNKVLVRCWKLLKPYTRKGIANDDDDDDDEEDDTGAKRRDLPSEGRIMEKDILSQAYNIVLSTGPKGITQSGIRFRMNNDKLESRMLCRRLERDGFVKGFMEDVGRQRTRRYISHKCVSVNEKHFLHFYFNSTSYQMLFQRILFCSCLLAGMWMKVNSLIHLLQAINADKERNHETLRLLRRKNLIIEAVRNLRVIEGLFPLQKMINEAEKQDGVSSKCCRKSILRIINSLSREGLLKIYMTTIIQDGITKKLELVVHPSVQSSDDIVTQVIEQVRFRISSSFSTPLCRYIYLTALYQHSQDQIFFSKPFCFFSVSAFAVPGLGKTLGFQPKMHRLRVVHHFLWYLIYGHPLRHSCVFKRLFSQLYTVIFCLSLIVYAEEESWKKFIPPARVHKELGSSWLMISDLLPCFPLSVFMQVTQINYKVDGLEEYLNDPVKQHYLVGSLPTKMRRQLLYKRKYIYSFHENLQRLVYMGLMQFGPMEKFKEKDQVFVYLRRNATIVDTTNAEPHYWLVTESPDKPFERRQYTFNTAEDVENYWFDLMCVCLNTPLGTHTGSGEVCDDGSIPGDGKGAGGLHSGFFAHLKRNWFWTSHLLACKTVCAQPVWYTVCTCLYIIYTSAISLCVCVYYSTDDIHAIVLHNLIQSTLAMTNSQMKSSRSFQVRPPIILFLCSHSVT
uniref:Uncharacterized protein n=1 Tax=Monopterus albus TaxID=43700 RepID=A0A3Q3R7E9_MONAL